MELTSSGRRIPSHPKAIAARGSCVRKPFVLRPRRGATFEAEVSFQGAGPEGAGMANMPQGNPGPPPAGGDHPQGNPR
jgi:hypothetical protein